MQSILAQGDWTFEQSQRGTDDQDAHPAKLNSQIKEAATIQALLHRKTRKHKKKQLEESKKSRVSFLI